MSIVSDWGDFGLLGLVIGALFAMLIMGFRVFVRLIKESQQDYSKDLHMMTEQHRDERKEWGFESDKRDQRYELSMKEFSQAIRDLREKL